MYFFCLTCLFTVCYQVHIRFKSDGFHVYINDVFIDKFYAVVNNGVPPQVTKVEWTVEPFYGVVATKVLVSLSLSLIHI